MRKNQLYLPLNLEKIIEPNESVRTLAEICEQLDYSELKKSYLRKIELKNLFVDGTKIEANANKI